MGFLGRFGRDRAKDSPPPSSPVGESADGLHPAAEATHRAVDAYWSGVGESDPDVITYLLNPMFQGAPPWPGTRQAYRVVRTPSTVIIASDGLSDPDPEGPGDVSGFGCEVFIESPDLLGATFEQLRSSYQFRAIESFAQNVADLGGISDHLRRHGVVSMELPGDEDAPPALQSPRGTVGALIGVPTGRAAGLSAPLGSVDVVALTLITADELEQIVEGGPEARAALAEQRVASGAGHLTTTR